MIATWTNLGEPKPTVHMGVHRITDPRSGVVTIRPYFRGQGASDEEYPHDADSGD